MKTRSCIWIKQILAGILLTFALPALSFSAVIIDHHCTDIRQIPEAAIIQAKENLHIAYGHTSHGSQLISGMGSSNGAQLDAFMTANGATPGLYLWNRGGENGALDLHDRAMGGDVGYYPQWVNNTRAYLGDPDPATGRGSHPDHAHINVIIWSWCGQAASRTEASMIDTYLDPMNQLEQDYPGITFVYMTGHLDGSGLYGNLHLRNEQIRNYCQANNKVLYDFADIESYDPDALVNYNALRANDNCDYDSDGNGSRDRNWALDWQASHTLGTDWWASGAAHSQHLNGNRKGYAAWWLWAVLAGWQNCLEPPADLTGVADPVARQITLTWTDRSHDPNEDGFIIQRRAGTGPWEEAFARVPADATTYADTDLAPGLYTYRVAALLEDNGQGVPCLSLPSNTVRIPISQEIPMAPSNLTSQVNGFDITLTWTDNSDNETHFILEREIDDTGFTLLATPGPDTVSHTDSNLAPFHTYTYRISAANANGASNFSPERSEYLGGATVTLTLKQGVDEYQGCRDTFLRSEYPGLNYGGDLYDSVIHSPKANFLVSFDLPEEIWGKQILSARLFLFCWTVSAWQENQSFELYQVQEAWEEGSANGEEQAGSATWNIREGTSPWTVPGGTHGPDALDSFTIPDTGHYPEFNITGLAQKWADKTMPNYGVILKNNTPVRTGIKASEYSEYGRPYLEIRYTAKACTHFDLEGNDQDVDGADLAAFITGFTGNCLAQFAQAFGR